MKKKGQVGFQAVTVAVVITGILLLLATTIVAKFAGSSESLITNFPGTNTNESVTGAFNTSLDLANQEEDCTLISVYNATPTGTIALTATNYTFEPSGCTISFNDGAWLGATVNVKVTYDYANSSAEVLSFRGIRTTTLDAFDLIVIGLIVLAAVAILAVLFMLGRG